MPSNKDMALFYSQNIGNNRYNSVCGVERTKAQSSGYSNLLSHIFSCHSNFLKEMTDNKKPLSFGTVSAKAKKVFGWKEWVKELHALLTQFESITKTLQRQFITIAEIRVLFDSVLEQFPELHHYLGTGEGTLTHYSDFELGIIAHLKGEPLTTQQHSALKVFEGEIQETTADATVLSHAEKILSEAAKKRKLSFHLDWISGTTNVVERLFSWVNSTYDDKRKKLLPINLESQIFLAVNKDFWDVFVINEIINSSE